MALTAGTRLGPYEILAALGAGGMGEVYRARDIRLDRPVAIKVLSGELVNDPQFRERFEREARTLSQLDHPHICTLYDVGEHQGASFLVMQYLEGETAADRLKKGPIPLGQAIKYAIQITDALHAAHRAGFTHRDLKPANVMLTKSGAKLLDFGLAKLRGPAHPLSMSAMTQMATRTAHGTILGTLHYMAPEQVEGREADARSDIFAFGATLYEMVTGRRPFDGEAPATVIGAILKDDPPPLSTLQLLSPPSLDHVVSTCLAKDPDERWQTAGDVKRQLTWIVGSDRMSVASGISAPRRGTNFRWIALALGLLLAVAAPSALRYWTVAPPEPPVTRFGVPPPENTTFASPNVAVSAAQLAISPDGRHLVSIATPTGGRPALWIRSLDTIQARKLPGTEDAAYPFWSPDSRFVGFFAEGKLKRTDVFSGLPLTLCDASSTPRGGTWSRDGIIVFAPDATGGLLKVSAEGGPTTPAIPLRSGETSHRWPSFLPDGQHFVVSVRGPIQQRGVYVGSLDGKKWTRVLDNILNAVYAPGYLLTVRDGALLAYPFDEKQLKVVGNPVQVAETVGGSSTLLAAFSVSANGVLAYSQGLAGPSRLMWFDRKGSSLGPATEIGYYVDFRLSPDERRLALSRVDPTTSNSDIWIADVALGTQTRFTSDSSTDLGPIWSPNGDRIVFQSGRPGVPMLFEKSSGGGSGAERLLTQAEAWFPTDWSPDGKILVYHTPRGANLFDVMLVPLAGDRKPVPFAASPFNESGGRFSSDGRWIAYASDESGRMDVYVQSFPSGDRKWPVSTGGGAEPRWRRDGRELFYLASDGALMSVPVSGTTTFESGAPRRLFQTRVPVLGSPYRVNYEVAADGDRFLVNTIVEGASPTPITVVMNWQSALTARETR